MPGGLPEAYKLPPVTVKSQWLLVNLPRGGYRASGERSCFLLLLLLLLLLWPLTVNPSRLFFHDRILTLTIDYWPGLRAIDFAVLLEANCYFFWY